MSPAVGHTPPDPQLSQLHGKALMCNLGSALPISLLAWTVRLSCTKGCAGRVLEVLNFTGKPTAALGVVVCFAGSNLNFFRNDNLVISLEHSKLKQE